MHMPYGDPANLYAGALKWVGEQWSSLDHNVITLKNKYKTQKGNSFYLVMKIVF